MISLFIFDLYRLGYKYRRGNPDLFPINVLLGDNSYTILNYYPSEVL
jgi:hypothetical protein